MRAAPPVSLLCHGGRCWSIFQRALPLAALGVAARWLLGQAGLEDAPAWAAAGVMLSGGLALRRWGRLGRQDAAAVDLRWDGQEWRADGVAGSLDVMIDLGGWMLLCLRPLGGARRRWIGVSARACGSGLHALRVAAYAGPVPAPGASRPGHLPSR